MVPRRAPVPRLREIAAVVFDLDGVLVDSEPLHLRAANRVLERYGCAISEAEYIGYIGLGERATWKQWKRRYGLAPPVDELVAAHSAERCRAIAAGVEPIPGSVALARDLHAAAVPLAIASSSTRPVIDALLEALGVSALFPVRVSGEDPEVSRSKPAPDVYLAAARHLGVAPAACLAIEDSEPGVRAAVAAGMHCVAVPNRWTRHQDFSAADAVLADARYLRLLLD